MKKVLTIALIAAMFVTSAFAVSFTGSAALKFGYDLDTKDYGFANAPSTTLKFGFELGSGSAEKAGEKDIKAELAAEFKVEFKEAKYTTDGTSVITIDGSKVEVEPAIDEESKGTYKMTGLKAVGSPVVTLKISKANILYKDSLTFGLLSAGKSADYAQSFNVDDDGKTLSDLIAPLKGVAGLTVEANKLGVSGGFGLTGNAGDEKTYNVLAHAAVADKELAEGLKLSAGFGALLTGNKNTNKSTLQANLKGAYSQDKLSASLAADFQTVLEKDKDAVVGFEAAVAAKYDFVSLNLYYYSVDNFKNNILDGKISASYTFEEKYTVTGSFTAYDMADKTRAEGDKTGESQEFKPALEVKAVVDSFTFTVGGSYKIISKGMAVYGKVAYKADMFTANFTADYAKTIGTDKTSQLYFTAGIESEAVVDGAKLALTYGKASSSDKLNVLKDQAVDQKLGKVTASATISF